MKRDQKVQGQKVSDPVENKKAVPIEMVQCTKQNLDALIAELQKLPWLTANPFLGHIQNTFSIIKSTENETENLADVINQ